MASVTARGPPVKARVVVFATSAPQGGPAGVAEGAASNVMPPSAKGTVPAEPASRLATTAAATGIPADTTARHATNRITRKRPVTNCPRGSGPGDYMESNSRRVGRGGAGGPPETLFSADSVDQAKPASRKLFGLSQLERAAVLRRPEE